MRKSLVTFGIWLLLFGPEHVPGEEPSAVRRLSLESHWAVVGAWDTPPDSPDGRHVLYVRFPQPPKGDTNVPAELWVCRPDVTGHRKLADIVTNPHDGAGQRFLTNDLVLYNSGGYVWLRRLDGGVVAKITGSSKHDADDTGFYLRGGPGVPIRRSDFEGEVSDVLRTRDLEEFAARLPGSDDPEEWRFRHLHIAPDSGLIAAQLDTGKQPWYLFTFRPDGSDIRFFGLKPMHVNWWDDETLAGADHMIPDGKPNDWSIRRWTREGDWIETLAGPGNHPTLSPDRTWIVTDPIYNQDPISLTAYDLTNQRALLIETYNQTEVVWRRKVHLNPAFSSNGRRVYWNRPVGKSGMQVVWTELNR